jgi:glycosyltransferase involved in cell wall biosynthesis
MSGQWITCQLGSREHFAVPRALHRAGCLKAVVTDVWMPPGSSMARLFDARGGPNATAWFGGRFEPELAGATVLSFSEQALLFEAHVRMRGTSGWDRVFARNAWFQSHAVRALDAVLAPGDTLFAYSYAARDLFALARSRGCRTVLGQIDAARHEEDIVAAEVARHPDVETGFRRLPERYWTDWLDECALADAVVVNSPWCARAIAAAGVAADKVRVVPLAYERSASDSAPVERAAPAAFSAGRPLRALFLGQVIPRKGVFALLDAADLVAGLPIEFEVVGETARGLDAELARRPNVRASGQVPNARIGEYFARADVFLLPTLSDGFALTLLEAASARVPIVCSDRCGDVIENDRGGLILPEVTGRAIADALRSILAAPASLDRWRADLALIPARFSIAAMASRWGQVLNSVSTTATMTDPSSEA